MPENLRSKVNAGLRWTALGQASGSLINVIATLVLLRLVAPEWFGLVAMVGVFSGFISNFAGLGIAESLVQRQQPKAQHQHTLFWWNVLAGLVGAILLLVTAPLLRWIYQSTIPNLVFWMLSAVVFFSVAGQIPLSVLQRDMAFRSLWKARFGAQAVAAVAAVATAWYGAFLTAILLRPLLQSALTMLSALWILRWQPRVELSLAVLRSHLNFGKDLTLNNLLGYGVRAVDDLAIGRWAGAEPLGYYSKAYSILLFPVRRVSSIVVQVFFPTFSALKQAGQPIGKAYTQICEAISLFTFPLMIWVAVEAASIVPFVLGPLWVPAVPIVQVLAILSSLQSVGTLSGMVFQSTGAVRLQLRLGLLLKPFMVAAIVATAWWSKDAWAVAVAYSAASIIALVPEQYYAAKSIGLGFGAVGRALAPAGGSTIIAVIPLLLLPGTSDLLDLALRTLVFGAIYGGSLYLLFPRAWKQQIGLARRFFNTKS